MKMIVAFIKEHKLSEVTLALRRIEGLSGASVSRIRGFGRGGAAGDPAPEEPTYYHPHERIEIACADDLVEEVVRTIERHAHTGLRGDGKIFVLEVVQAVRISTGERGHAAV